MEKTGKMKEKGKKRSRAEIGKKASPDRLEGAGKEKRAGNPERGRKPDQAERMRKAGKPERAGNPERGRKPDQAERMKKAGKPGRAGSPERDGRPDQAERMRKAGKPGRAGKTEKPAQAQEWKTGKNYQKDPGSGKAEKQPGRDGKTGRQPGRNRGGKAGGRQEGVQFHGNKGEKELQKQKAKEICHAFGECGGCQLLGIPYEVQLAQKEHDLAKLLKPYVKLEGMIGMEEPEHYRNKVNAAFTHDRSGKPLSGVYKEGTHYIIPIEECVLENQKADEIIGSIRQLLPSFKIKTYDEDMDYGLLRHVMVRTGHATGQIMVVLVLASPILPSKRNFAKALLRRHPEITTIVVNVNDRKTSMVLGDKEQVIYGKGYIEDVLCGITFKISPKSFYQVNSVQAEKLYEKAVEYAGLTGRETVLDAYCGIGTIGMVAASKAKRVIGVELNSDAVKDAVANARGNGIRNTEFYQKDAGEFMAQLAEQGEKIDVVFMDPPRTGSDGVFLDSLAALKPERVVYVSCNPETLARDLDVLTKKGYRVMKGMGCDMFPFCGHVEAVCCLSRIK